MQISKIVWDSLENLKDHLVSHEISLKIFKKFLNVSEEISEIFEKSKRIFKLQNLACCFRSDLPLGCSPLFVLHQLLPRLQARKVVSSHCFDELWPRWLLTLKQHSLLSSSNVSAGKVTLIPCCLPNGLIVTSCWRILAMCLFRWRAITNLVAMWTFIKANCIPLSTSEGKHRSWVTK